MGGTPQGLPKSLGVSGDAHDASLPQVQLRLVHCSNLLGKKLLVLCDSSWHSLQDDAMQRTAICSRENKENLVHVQEACSKAGSSGTHPRLQLSKALESRKMAQRDLKFTISGARRLHEASHL